MGVLCCKRQYDDAICECIITCDYKIMKLNGRYGGVGSNDASCVFS